VSPTEPPGQPGRRERKKRATRRLVQDTALDLFATQGYAETTIAAVAEAADVAVRTVTTHFPTKEDLLLGDDPFTAASLAAALAGREQDTLATVRAWLEATLRELEPDDAERVWHRRALRARLILEDDRLRGRVRGEHYALERVVAAGVAEDLGTTPDALAARLTALSVVTGLRELYETSEARAAEGQQPLEALLALVDDVLRYARAGLAALTG
jgi:AcrR family transcriptional regulator